MLPRIQVDFDTITQTDEYYWHRVLIDAKRQPELLNVLKPDLRVVLFAPSDLEIEANIEFDKARNTWYGVPDWHTIKYYRFAISPHNPGDRDKLPRIAVDFNTTATDPRRRVHIPTHVHSELHHILRPDLRVLLFEEHDLEVEAVVVFDEEDRIG